MEIEQQEDARAVALFQEECFIARLYLTKNSVSVMNKRKGQLVVEPWYIGISERWLTAK
jgi:hypothetical protein